jgi:NTE family protein
MRWHRQRSDLDGTGRRKVAFVLSGGGALGAMQAGQLLAVLEAGITPDLVLGVSAGALNGAAIAHRPTVEMAKHLMDTWRDLRRDDVLVGSRAERAWHLVRHHPHLYRPDGLAKLVSRFLPLDDLAHLTTAFEAGTVNLDEARVEFHAAGDPRSVLVASASLPGVFPPVLINGNRHVDGGIAVNLPIQRARDLGATSIIAFDCRAGTRHRLPDNLSALAVLTSSIAVAREILTPSHDEASDVICLPAPDAHGIGVFDFSHAARLAHDGRELVASFLDRNPVLAALSAAA